MMHYSSALIKRPIRHSTTLQPPLDSMTLISSQGTDILASGRHLTCVLDPTDLEQLKYIVCDMIKLCTKF